MIKKIRRRIISETKQTALLIDSAAQNDLRCAFCGDENLISPLTAAKFLKISTREVFRLIETGRVHFIELPDRQIFVCLQSIL